MAAQERLDPALKRTAIAVVVGALAVVFDTTIVSVSMHTLVTELNSSIEVVQWVSTAYLLALGVAIPVVGWAQARIGGKRLWLVALAVFLIASVLCALAWDAPSLIAFRALQGLGGGVMLPLMSTLVVQAAKGQNLGRVIATMSLPTVLGPILGPVLGGLILSSLSWHWMFLVNVPFCVVGLVLAWKLIPADTPTAQKPKLDWVGLLLLSPAIVGLLFGLSNVTGAGGFARGDVLVPLIAGVVLLAGFIWWAIVHRGTALVDLHLFGHRPLAASSALLFLSGIALYGAMLVLPLYWQELRGTDALGAGLLLIPQGVGTFLSRSTAGRLTDRIGARWVCVAGFAIVALGTLPFAFAGTDTNEWWLMAALLVRGFGLGAVTIPLMSVAFVGLERDDVPHASIITRVASQVGGSFGVAVLAVILAASVTTGITGGFTTAFWWATALAVLGVPLSLLLPTNTQSRANPSAGPATVPAGAAPTSAGRLT